MKNVPTKEIWPVSIEGINGIINKATDAYEILGISLNDSSKNAYSHIDLLTDN